MTASPNRDRKAERRSATRADILEAAWDLARRGGVAEVTLREVGLRVGMRAPSLYTHFESKNAIYDAMFEQAWSAYLAVAEQSVASLPAAPRKALLAMVQTFVDFAIADPVRFQLMNQRMVVDFEPTPAAYAPSLQVMAMFRDRLSRLGITAEADADLCVAIVGGLIEAQIANEPEGVRWIGQLQRAMDMFADEVGLPGPRMRRQQ